jgi:hypothetical protein
MKRFLYILLLCAGCVPCPAFAKGIGVPAIAVRDSAVSTADTTWIWPDSIRSGNYRGNFEGNPWTSYLRSDVADTAYNLYVYKSNKGADSLWALRVEQNGTTSSPMNPWFAGWFTATGVSNGYGLYAKGTTGSALLDGPVVTRGMAVDASPDSAVSIVSGELRMAAWPTFTTPSAVDSARYLKLFGSTKYLPADSFAMASRPDTLLGPITITNNLTVDTLIANKEARADSIKALKGLFVLGG